MSRRALQFLAALVAVVGLGTAAWVAGSDSSGSSADPVPVPPTVDEETVAETTTTTDDEAGDDGAVTTVPRPTTTTTQPEAAEPVRVRIPAIEVDAPIGPLAVQEDRTLEVPTDFDATGWWVDGPEPGEPGPAVVLGHVDSYTGPAVFFRLRELVPGDRILVDRADGTTVSYVVERFELHAKDDFPTDEVYGATDGPELRLVTCGGDFDESVRSYLGNYIVWATLDEITETPFGDDGDDEV